MHRFSIASAMICVTPESVPGRIVLSADGNVWHSPKKIPNEIQAKVTDDFGRAQLDDFSNVQIFDFQTVSELEQMGLFCGFRAVERVRLEILGFQPPAMFYDEIIGELVFVGWDVCSSNNWSSASLHGRFPVDATAGQLDRVEGKYSNGFSLISDEKVCVKFCEMNNLSVAEHAPWYPVGLFVTIKSFARFQALGLVLPDYLDPEPL